MYPKNFKTDFTEVLPHHPFPISLRLNPMKQTQMCGAHVWKQCQAEDAGRAFSLKVEKDTGLNKHPKFLLSAVHAICGADSGGPGMLLEEWRSPGPCCNLEWGFPRKRHESFRQNFEQSFRV